MTQVQLSSLRVLKPLTARRWEAAGDTHPYPHIPWEAPMATAEVTYGAGWALLRPTVAVLTLLSWPDLIIKAQG